MGRPVLIVTLPLVAAGCAWQDWTRDVLSRHFVKEQAEIEQRFLAVEGRVSEQSTGLERLEGRVTGLEASVAEARGMARHAGDRAEVALAKADAVDKRLARALDTRSRGDVVRVRTLVGAVHVRFGFDRADLDDGAETALTTVIREVQENPQVTLDLEGSTDPVGTRVYNAHLSRRRVDAVRRYLVARGVDPQRIIHSAGVGLVAGSGMPDEHRRRVTVKLMQYPD